MPPAKQLRTLIPARSMCCWSPLPDLNRKHAQYKGATTNTQRRHVEVLRETQDQVIQLPMGVLKTEEDSRELNTRDRVGQIEARAQALGDLAKKTEGPKTSPAPGPPEGFAPNAVAHLACKLGQVKSDFEGQVRILGHNIDALKAQLQEEPLRPKGVNPMDRSYYPDRAEPAPRGPFGGYFSEPSRVSEAGPSNTFMHPQPGRTDGFHYETPQYHGVSDHRLPTHDGMRPRGN